MTNQNFDKYIQENPTNARQGASNGIGRRIVIGSLVLTVVGALFVMIMF